MRQHREHVPRADETAVEQRQARDGHEQHQRGRRQDPRGVAVAERRRLGGVGTVVALVCCFTPALVLLLGSAGLSVLVGWWLDAILFPALAIFVAITAYGLYLRWRAGMGTAAQPEADLPSRLEGKT